MVIGRIRSQLQKRQKLYQHSSHFFPKNSAAASLCRSVCLSGAPSGINGEEEQEQEAVQSLPPLPWLLDKSSSKDDLGRPDKASQPSRPVVKLSAATTLLDDFQGRLCFVVWGSCCWRQQQQMMMMLLLWLWLTIATGIRTIGSAEREKRQEKSAVIDP